MKFIEKSRKLELVVFWCETRSYGSACGVRKGK